MNGLTQARRLMVDKLITVRTTKLGDRLGILADADIVRLNRAIIVFLGIAAAPSWIRHLLVAVTGRALG